jgi:TolB-like protein/DNA-binding winged helix-turn-helix (wHTH) protein/Tfp pilus assembly protein PilF
VPGPGSREILRFGEFDLDPAAFELRRRGVPVRLERQPMDLLLLLVDRRGELVSRAEIIDRLWGKDVFVDVETGVHTAARKIRQALGDSVSTPAYLETVPGRGYRFIAPIEVVPASQAGVANTAPAPASPIPDNGGVPATDVPSKRFRISSRAAFALLLAIAALVAFGWFRLSETRLEIVRLAVLPFENMTGDRDREYLADGLTEEAAAAIGQIDPARVQVIGRTSTRTYQATRKSAAEIGRELQVDYLVEGSIRAEDSRLRIMSKLTRVRDQSLVWSASYDREPASPLALQAELSAAIAEQIRHRLSPDHAAALARRQTRNAQAYDLYLRGVAFANQRTPATNRLAIDSFSKAAALDPSYALAWSALANVYSASPINGDGNPADVATHARQAAENAVRTAPDLAEAQFAFAYVKWMLDWDWPAAEASFRRAVDLDPSFAMGFVSLGHSLSQAGRHNEAAPLMRRARELDPLSGLTHAMSSQVAFQARDYADAIEQARQAVVVAPELWIGHVTLGQAYEAVGQPAQAIQALETADRLSTGNSKAVAMRGHLLGRIGRRAEALQVLETLGAASRQRYVPPYAFALIYAGLGDRDKAFEWLDRAYDVKDVHLMFLTVDSKWDPYRSDPRFAALLARCDFMRQRKVP